MDRKVYASSRRDDWETPPELFERLNDEFNFTLDPCATKESAKCEKYYTIKEDGLIQSWEGEIAFMNPPYGRKIYDWIQKAWYESGRCLVVCLIPSRTDTVWWHRYVMEAKEIRFISGRLKFSDNKFNAPFPSVVVIFDGKKRKAPKVISYE